MYDKKQRIISEGGYVMGSKVLGNISLFFLDPVGHIHIWIKEAWHTETQIQFVPSHSFFPPQGNQTEDHLFYDPSFIGVQFTLRS